MCGWDATNKLKWLRVCLTGRAWTVFRCLPEIARADLGGCIWRGPEDVGWQFQLQTDYGSLTWLAIFKEPEGQLALWLERLQEFHFCIVLHPGKRHGNADSLSQWPCTQCGHDNNEETPTLVWMSITLLKNRAQLWAKVTLHVVLVQIWDHWNIDVDDLDCLVPPQWTLLSSQGLCTTWSVWDLHRTLNLGQILREGGVM